MLLFLQRKNKIVIPAKAGIQCILVFKDANKVWIPAFAEMTVMGCKRLLMFSAVCQRGTPPKFCTFSYRFQGHWTVLGLNGYPRSKTITALRAIALRISCTEKACDGTFSLAWSNLREWYGKYSTHSTFCATVLRPLASISLENFCSHQLRPGASRSGLSQKNGYSPCSNRRFFHDISINCAHLWWRRSSGENPGLSAKTTIGANELPIKGSGNNSRCMHRSRRADLLKVKIVPKSSARSIGWL